MVNFKENIIFKVPGGGGGVKIFPGGGGGGGPTYSRGGGSNCFFPKETQITCDFPGGSGPPAPHPLWIRTWLRSI